MTTETRMRFLKIASKIKKSCLEAYKFSANAYSHEAYAQAVDVLNLANELAPRGFASEIARRLKNKSNPEGDRK